MNGVIEHFDSEAGYRAAIARTLAGAQREIHIFDRDLLRMGFDEIAQVELLNRFLSTSTLSQLHVVVHDVAPLQSRLPRLLSLLRDHAHHVEVRQTPEHLRHLADCWVLAEQGNGTIRFHVDHARGKLVTAMPAELEPWWQRASDLWNESAPCTPWATAGL